MKKDPPGFRAALEGLLEGMDSATRIRESFALGFWEQVVGPQAAAATEPECVREGVLIVRTKSSVWSHELTFLKGHLLSQLNRRVGRPVLRDIIFRAQGVKKTAVAADSPGAPTDAELASVKLSAAERAALEAELSGLERVEDGPLRESLHHAAIHRHRLASWRRRSGWTECPECGCLHSDSPGLCPVCRVVASAELTASR